MLEVLSKTGQHDFLELILATPYQEVAEVPEREERVEKSLYAEQHSFNL